MWLVVGVKSICDEDWEKTRFKLQMFRVFQAQEPETNKVIKLDEPEEEETNKVKGKIRTGGWELLKRQRSPLDHEICHSSMDEKKDL